MVLLYPETIIINQQEVLRLKISMKIEVNDCSLRSTSMFRQPANKVPPRSYAT